MMLLVAYRRSVCSQCAMKHVVFLLTAFLLAECSKRPGTDGEYDHLRSLLSDFDVLKLSSLQQHSVRKRDVQSHTHAERLLTFTALHRHFRLYLTSNTELFTEDFSAVVVEKDGTHQNFEVHRQNFFTGHVIGEENSRVQAHVDDNDFTAHILTDEAEYNIEPLWRLTQSPPDGRLLVYRSEDIRNVSRLAAPKVCGYITAEASQLLPEHVRTATAAEEKQEEEGEENSRVQAHVDDNDFTAHILTDEAEYNIEPLWRLTQSPPDGRLLVYRSEDIRNVSRLAAPKVCGYITAEASQLLPEHVRTATAAEEKQEEEGERFRVQVGI
ncbi:hypothetical protein PGIGA_G00099010 [Pangasianodon gigas]|uniref:Uncharacterized protein n=1 Tax=Pangasianodon gigas TaxID=30993 RepID=A0ACC5XFC3_PANGG|nr:hypothetical protein [Pangasianodon gigas]